MSSETNRGDVTEGSLGDRVWAAITAALCLLLLDIAVETLLSQAPVRWWLAVAVGMGALVVVSWRRFLRLRWTQLRWSSLAIAGALGVLGVIAGSAWFPDGVRDGIRCFGQPTSRVLATVSAAGVLGGTYQLVVSRTLPAPLRLASTILGLYGFVAFGLAVHQSLEFDQLMRGGGFLDTLPLGLQGAVIGSLALVPLAVILLVTNLFRTSKSAARRVLAFRAAALSLCVSVALAGMVPRYSAPYLDLSQEQLGRRLSQSIDRVADLAEELPRDSFDLQDLVKGIGGDPERLRHWVATQTSFVPYLGRLRGPRGVLMDRLGNSLDRALLLHEMLRRTGRRARLARAELSMTEAQRQIAVARTHVLQVAGDLLQTDDTADTKAMAAELNIDATQLEGVLRAQRERHLKWIELLLAEAAAQADHLVASLSPPPAEEDRDLKLARAATDHWWVQLWDGDHWVDLELPAAPGQTPPKLPAPAEVLQPNQLPESLSHFVEIAIAVRRGGEVTQTVLKHRLAAADLVATSLTIRNVPLDWKHKGRTSSDELLETIRGTNEWTPVLMFDEDLVHGTPFSLDDYEAPALGGPSPGALDIFSELPSTPPSGTRAKQASGPSSEITAQWIEYTLSVPGKEPEVVRRRVFDLLTQEAGASNNPEKFELSDSNREHRGLALLRTTTVLVLNSSLSPSFIAHRVAGGLIANKELLVRLATGGLESLEGYNPGKRAEFLSPVFLLALARQARWDPEAIAYIDRPNVVAHHQGLDRWHDGTLIDLEAFDVVANRVAMFAEDSSKSFEFAVRQGVWDTAWESVVLGSRCIALRRKCVGLGGNPILEGIFTSDPVVASVWAPGSGAAVAHRTWWRIDPATGTTLGIGDRGWGQTTAEYLVLTFNVASQVICFAEADSTGAVVYCGLTSAIAIVGGVTQVFSWYLKAVSAGKYSGSFLFGAKLYPRLAQNQDIIQQIGMWGGAAGGFAGFGKATYDHFTRDERVEAFERFLERIDEQRERRRRRSDINF